MREGGGRGRGARKAAGRQRGWDSRELWGSKPMPSGDHGAERRGSRAGKGARGEPFRSFQSRAGTLCFMPTAKGSQEKVFFFFLIPTFFAKQENDLIREVFLKYHAAQTTRTGFMF